MCFTIVACAGGNCLYANKRGKYIDFDLWNLIYGIEPLNFLVLYAESNFHPPCLLCSLGIPSWPLSQKKHPAPSLCIFPCYLTHSSWELPSCLQREIPPGVDRCLSANEVLTRKIIFISSHQIFFLISAQNCWCPHVRGAANGNWTSGDQPTRKQKPAGWISGKALPALAPECFLLVLCLCMFGAAIFLWCLAWREWTWGDPHCP